MSKLDLAQLRALTSPARQEIIDAVQRHAPCSIAEIAEYLGRPADSLYYHMRRLTKVGLLREHSTRRAKRREETLYETPHRCRTGALVACNPGHREGRKAAIKSTAAMLRATARDFADAYNTARAVPAGRDRNIAAGRYKGWLSPEEVRAVLEHMNAVRAILAQSQSRQASDGGLYAASIVLAPLEPNGKEKAEQPAASPKPSAHDQPLLHG